MNTANFNSLQLKNDALAKTFIVQKLKSMYGFLNGLVIDYDYDIHNREHCYILRFIIRDSQIRGAILLNTLDYELLKNEPKKVLEFFVSEIKQQYPEFILRYS